MNVPLLLVAVPRTLEIPMGSFTSFSSHTNNAANNSASASDAGAKGFCRLSFTTPPQAGEYDMCVPVLSLTEPVGLHAAPDDSKVNLSVHVHSNELLAMKRTHSMVTVGGLVAAIALCVSGGVIGTFVALILMGILLLTDGWVQRPRPERKVVFSVTSVRNSGLGAIFECDNPQWCG